MKNPTNRLVSKVEHIADRAEKTAFRGYLRFQRMKAGTHRVLCQQSGEGFVDTALFSLLR